MFFHSRAYDPERNPQSKGREVHDQKFNHGRNISASSFPSGRRTRIEGLVFLFKQHILSVSERESVRRRRVRSYELRSCMKLVTEGATLSS